MSCLFTVIVAACALMQLVMGVAFMADFAFGQWRYSPATLLLSAFSFAAAWVEISGVVQAVQP